MGFHYEAKSKKRDERDEDKPKSGFIAKLGRGFGTAIFRDGKIIIEPDTKESSLNE